MDEALENLAKAAQSFEDRDEGAAAEDGDQLVIDFVGRIDGTPFDGGTAEDYPLVLGSGSFIPGFEPQLVGAKAGEEKDVTVNFPEDYGASHLAGKEAVFAVTVKSVRAPKAAAIDDTLASQYGAADLETFKGQIRERIEADVDVGEQMGVHVHEYDAYDVHLLMFACTLVEGAEPSRTHRRLDEGADPGNRPAHDQAVHLARSLIAIEGLSVREEACDVVVEHDAVAAEYLAAQGDNLTHRRGREGLRHRRVFVALLAVVEHLRHPNT